MTGEPSTARSIRSYETAIVLGAFVALVLVVGMFVLVVSHWYSGSASELIYDEQVYAGYAENLLWRGAFVYESHLGSHVAFRGPGYPLFVSFVLALTGSYNAVRFAQALLLLLTVLLTGATAYAVAGRRRPAFVAAGLIALHPAPWMFAIMILPTTLFMFVMALATWLVVCARRGERYWSIGAGLVTGAAAMVRGEALVLPLFFVFADQIRARALGKSSGAVRWGPYCISFLLAITPWFVRNAVVFDGRVVYQSSFGHHLWDGNYPGSPGDQISRLFSGNDIPEWYYQPFLEHRDDEIAWNRNLMLHGLRAIADDPVRFAVRGFKKIAYLWNTDIRAWIWLGDRNYQGATSYPVILGGLMLWTLIAGLLLPGRGLAMLLGAPRGALVSWLSAHALLVTGVAFVTLGQARYHLGLFPALAAHLAVTSGKLTRRERWRVNAVWIGWLLLIVLPINEWSRLLAILKWGPGS